jgi:hypothetical protein
MDILGMRALRAAHRRAGDGGVDDVRLGREALAGDLVANTAYYALVGAGDRRHVWTRGLALGLLAGLGAIVLPRHVGLGDPPHAGRPDTQLMTMAWYLTGGLVAAAVSAGQSAPRAAVR